MRDNVATIWKLSDLGPGGPVRVVVLGFWRGAQVPPSRPPRPGRYGIDYLTPATLEQESGRRSDLLVAAEQTLPLDGRQRHEIGEVAGIGRHERRVVAQLRRNERHRLRRDWRSVR